jgi:hypothetical protein
MSTCLLSGTHLDFSYAHVSACKLRQLEWTHYLLYFCFLIPHFFTIFDGLDTMRMGDVMPSLNDTVEGLSHTIGAQCNVTKHTNNSSPESKHYSRVALILNRIGGLATSRWSYDSNAFSASSKWSIFLCRRSSCSSLIASKSFSSYAIVNPYNKWRLTWSTSTSNIGFFCKIDAYGVCTRIKSSNEATTLGKIRDRSG